MVCSPFDDIEIRKFQVAVEAIKCVLGLEATVHDVERVQVFQCQHYFSGIAVAHTAQRNPRQSARLTADNKQTHIRHITRDIPGYLDVCLLSQPWLSENMQSRVTRHVIAGASARAVVCCCRPLTKMGGGGICCSSEGCGFIAADRRAQDNC
jgi:hypothetical protein